MVDEARKGRPTRVRVEVSGPNSSDDTGEFLWPLTSSGAEAARRSAEFPRGRGGHPTVPQTLCDGEGPARRCIGMVAEPLN